MIKSLLDTDTYKLTMMYAVWKLYPKSIASYTFKNRNKQVKFTETYLEQVKKNIRELEALKLTLEERKWLGDTFGFDLAFLDYLSAFKFNTNHVKVELIDEDLHLTISEGTWLDTILFEVPLLAIISETYFQIIDKDWSLTSPVNQSELAWEKIQEFEKQGLIVSEFGTRRRRSYETQKIFIKEMVKAKDKGFKCIAGTSNLHFARLYNLKPIGTIAHEMIMASSVLDSRGLLYANRSAFEGWMKVYQHQPAMAIALPDTYGIDAFLNDFDKPLASWYRGVRQDSGDGIVFLRKIVNHYHSLGIDPSTKVVVFSDSLQLSVAIKYKQEADRLGIQASFGIGTWLTNDFKKLSSPSEKSPALNIVIKLATIAPDSSHAPKPVVKLSDEKGKHHGDPETIKHALKVFNME